MLRGIESPHFRYSSSYSVCDIHPLDYSAKNRVKRIIRRADPRGRMRISMVVEGKFGVHIPVDGKLAEVIHRNDCIKNLTGPFIEERTLRAT